MGMESIRKVAWGLALPRDEKWVLVYLASFADRKTLQCYPAKATIARACDLTALEVDDVLHKLRLRGFVTWERREKSSNVYTLHRDAMVAFGAGQKQQMAG